MKIKEYQKLQFKVAFEAYKSTCHFVTKDDDIKSYASGVFVEVDNNHFLITTAHVIENKESDIYIRIGEHEILNLGGEFTKNETSDRANDKIDIAILKLNDGTVKNIGNNYTFLKQDELGVNHNYTELPMYISVGFPASLSKTNKYKKKFVSKPFVFSTKLAKKEVYKELDCRLFVNIIVHYDKKKVQNYSTDEIVTGPDAYGISGSGLWFIPEQENEEDEKLTKKLVGILTEWPIKNKKYWIGTSIEVITELIREKYKLNLEKSNQIKL